jgi:hypothetical protein
MIEPVARGSLLALLLIVVATLPVVAQVQLARLDGVVVDGANRPVGGAAVIVSDPARRGNRRRADHDRRWSSGQRTGGGQRPRRGVEPVRRALRLQLRQNPFSGTHFGAPRTASVSVRVETR